MTDAAAVQAAPLPDDAADWQRLHPATLALAIVKLGPRSFQFLPAVAALGFTGNWGYLVPAILAFLLISLLAAWFQWLRFRFRVGVGICIDTVATEVGDFGVCTAGIRRAVCRCAFGGLGCCSPCKRHAHAEHEAN